MRASSARKETEDLALGLRQQPRGKEAPLANYPSSARMVARIQAGDRP